MITCLISGGQTGADQGGLLAAKALDIPTGGYAPKGWRTEAGPAPWLQDYELMEWETEDYKDRTKKNVQLSDGSIIFGRRSPGSNATEEFCRKMEKPLLWIAWNSQGYTALPYDNWVMPLTFGKVIFRARPLQVRLWLQSNKILVLNCAGNRESKNPGIQQFTQEFLTRVLCK